MANELSANYSIGDLEALSGIKAHTIRIWEKRYGIVAPRRTEHNIRYYTNEDLRKLLNIGLLNRHGHKISEISGMSQIEIASRVASMALVQSDHVSERLLLSLMDMDELLFDKVFSNIIMEKGLEQAMIETIFPFLARIGVMWQIGTIGPAEEHFFSNLIRNKIIMATDLVSSPPASDAISVLLFLPEGELHEIGLLFYNYAFRRRGYKTVYLGQSVPYENMDRIYTVVKPQIVVTSVTHPGLAQSFKDICADICSRAKNALVYFTGPATQLPPQDLPHNARFTPELRALLEQH